MNVTMEKFEEALQDWFERAKKISIYPLEMVRNRKYIKIIKTLTNGQITVYTFIDMDGNVLFPDSWKRPSKRVRGNIWEIGKEGVNEHGTDYKNM